MLEQLSDFLDDESRDELCRAIKAHLADCHNCRVEVDSVQKTIVLYRADRQIATPPAVSARLRELLELAYREARMDAPAE
ncbi:MAG: zf-HC2 domain-containing protein [Candidatus Eisenbacteria bacterium]|nr:zf-HC2 domain-containing protein [Candidatus Eisenbacteria bacterium]